MITISAVWVPLILFFLFGIIAEFFQETAIGLLCGLIAGILGFFCLIYYIVVGIGWLVTNVQIV